MCHVSTRLHISTTRPARLELVETEEQLDKLFKLDDPRLGGKRLGWGQLLGRLISHPEPQKTKALTFEWSDALSSISNEPVTTGKVHKCGIGKLNLGLADPEPDSKPSTTNCKHVT